MGGGSKTETQNSVQSSQIDPMQMQQYQDNYTKAQGAAASLTPYTGQLTAGFNPTQLQAQGALSAIGTDPSYNATNNAAISGVQGILGAPTNTTVTGQPVNASTIAGTDLSPYLNPYQSDVIDASVNANERARQIASVSDAQKASAAGAFGGSRSGVLSSLTNGEYDRNDQTNIAGLNAANFAQAQAAAGADAATKNSVGEFNSSQNVNAQQQTIANKLAQQGLQINAAGQIVSMNNAALQGAATQGGILASVGDAQQAQAQKELSDAYSAYTQGQNLTLAQQQLLNQALGIIPVEQTTTTNGTATTKSSSGLGGVLGGIGSLALGIGSMGTSTLGGSLLGGLLGGSK